MRFGAARMMVGGGAAILAGLLAGSAATQAPLRLSAPPLPASAVPNAMVASEGDAETLRQVFAAARAGDGERIRSALSGISDPLARKIAVWAMADGAPDAMSFFEIDSARRDLAGWPRALGRQRSAEQKLETSGLDASQVIAWFGGGEPETAEGAIALAAALQAQGRPSEAATLIRRWWRTRVFELEAQQAMRSRFATTITAEDSAVRADLLLYGPQGPAAQDVVDSLSGPEHDLADARLALRSGRSDANARVAALSEAQRGNPGLIWEQALYFYKHGMANQAWSISAGVKAPPTEEVAARSWPDKRRMITAAMQAGQNRAAYNLARDCGMSTGADAAEAEFRAGWLALIRLNDPRAAELHFARLAAAGASPITQGRALYWQGRAAEALGKTAEAQAFYRRGADYITVFYGQLAAEKVGLKTIDLGKDPVITAADKVRFDGREVVQAARMLNAFGLRDPFRAFVLHIDDTLPTAAEAALLVDMARTTGDYDLSMRAVRTAAQRGFNLPERGYPVLQPAVVPGGAELAFVLSITRQESNFDPRARSGADARGMMQLLPATGRDTARRLGEPFTVERLYEADFNMKLGARYLGDMTNTFGGSYAMAAAGYNAGPGRPPQWIALCGDPRGATTDPLDFVECIPFSETRNYVMRAMETTQVYRARLNGGTAPLRLWADLKRGGYSHAAPDAPAR